MHSIQFEKPNAMRLACTRLIRTNCTNLTHSLTDIIVWTPKRCFRKAHIICQRRPQSLHTWHTITFRSPHFTFSTATTTHHDPCWCSRRCCCYTNNLTPLYCGIVLLHKFAVAQLSTRPHSPALHGLSSECGAYAEVQARMLRTGAACYRNHAPKLTHFKFLTYQPQQLSVALECKYVPIWSENGGGEGVGIEGRSKKQRRNN